MYICGAVVEIERLVDKGLAAGFRGFPEALEQLTLTVWGSFSRAREVDAAEEKGTAMGINEAGAGSMYVMF